MKTLFCAFRLALALGLAGSFLIGEGALRCRARAELAAPSPAASTLDLSERIVRNALERYHRIRGYQAVLEKEELGEDGKKTKEKSFIKFDKPLAIFMGWSEGERKGMQLLYAENRFDGKMVVRLPGFLFDFIPLMSVPEDDPRVRRHAKHSIKTAGIGYFIEDLWETFTRLRAQGAIEVASIREGVAVGAERGTLVEFILHDPSETYPQKGVVFSDATGLPIEIRLYRPEGNLVERYSYVDLQFDPTADDPAFRKFADPRMVSKYAEALKS